MDNKNILKVIDELGNILSNKDNEILLQKYEIENLKKKIEQIENYIDFYSKEE